MTHDEIRARHFERLNSYRQSAEYAEYAGKIGAAVPQGPLTRLLGNRWEIDREVYEEFLEMLPPLGWRGGSFFMSEFSFGNITAKYTKEGDKYYCEFARYPELRRQPVETPWGTAQHVTEIAPGIVSYSTASHGGIHLSDERIADMPAALQEFVPFGGPQPGPGRWFEEDCDWSVVALAFPQFFTEEEVRAAHATLKAYRPSVYEAFVGKSENNQQKGSCMKRYVGERTPDGVSVVVIPEGGEVYELNPRFDLRNHSPDGFEFGYAGSGPAQLSLALLADALGDDERAQDAYQSYKFKVIARLSGDRFDLTDEQIKQTVAALEAERGRGRE